jgi:hypothetical protein
MVGDLIQMSEKINCTKNVSLFAISILLCSFLAGKSFAGIDGSDALGIDGSDSLGIDGSDAQGIDGSDAQGIDGSDTQGIDGSDAQGIDGSDALGIDGSDSLGIDGSDAQGIDGSDAQGIDGSDAQGIDGSDAQGEDNGDLLVIGSVDFISGDFASILGQSVFSESLVSSGIAVGDTVAVYGSIDQATGGIVDSHVIAVAAGNAGSFLTGIVDQVNPTLGIAVVSGVAVNYTALLADGAEPVVGQRVSVSGRVYNGIGLVAEKK